MRIMRKALIGFVMFAVIMSMSIISNATTLTLSTSTSAEEVEVGKTVTITVNWNEKMQAADFILNYDSSKLEYQSSSIPEGFIKASNGKVKVVWFSSTGTENLEKATFTFKAISEGNVILGTTIDGGFSTATLTQPDNYDVNSKATLTIIGASQDNGDEPGNNGNNNPGTENPGNNNPGTENPGNNNSGTGDTGNSGSGNNNSGTGNSGNSGSGSSNSGTPKPGNSASESNNSGSGNTGNPIGQVSANPTQKPTVLPKAGAIHILWILPILIFMIAFSYYKIKEYKDI